MSSWPVRGHGLPTRYVWPTPRANVRYTYIYERDGEQRMFNGSSLDMGPRQTLIDDGWKPIVKVRIRIK